MHSVAGKAGDVILIHTDITDWTAATVSFLTSAVTTFNARIGAVTLTGGDVTTALGYTPYDTANPAHYQTDTQLAAAVAPLYPSANPANYQTASQVGSTVSGAVAAYVPLSQRAAANGVATLDGTGVVPTAQLPGAATGTLSYKGGWNASTNTPAWPLARSQAACCKRPGITTWSL